MVEAHRWSVNGSPAIGEDPEAGGLSRPREPKAEAGTGRSDPVASDDPMRRPAPPPQPPTAVPPLFPPCIA